MNKVILIGRAGKDPEVRILAGGTKVANFSLATSKHFTKNGEKQSQTTWHNIVCWLKLADLAESYIKKGDQVCIEGEIQIRDWTDKDGNKRQSFEVNCNNIELLGGKKSEGEEKHETPVIPPKIEDQGATDDLPF